MHYCPPLGRQFLATQECRSPVREPHTGTIAGMSHTRKLASHYLELADTPASQVNYAGEDVRYSVEFEALETELSKATSLHGGGPIDWQKILEGSERLLREQSKDLRVAAWLTWALQQRESFSGLLAGLGMLLRLCEQHWDDVHPRKPVGRYPQEAGGAPPRKAGR